MQCETSGRGPRDFGSYAAIMRKDGEWGDHLTLQARVPWTQTRTPALPALACCCFADLSARGPPPQAVADCYGVEIFVVSSFMLNGILEVKPHDGVRFERALWLSFFAEVHYNSIYPVRRPPRCRRALEETAPCAVDWGRAASRAVSDLVRLGPLAQVGEAPQTGGVLPGAAPGVMSSLRKMTDDVFFGRL